MSYTRVDSRLQVGDLQPHAILPSRKAGDQWQHKGCSDQPRRLSCDHVLCRICRKRISDFPVTKASKTPKMGGRHSRHVCSETLMRDRSLRAKRSAIYIYIYGNDIYMNICGGRARPQGPGGSMKYQFVYLKFKNPYI